MKIGVTLPIKYLIGTQETAAATPFFNAFGAPNDCLAELRRYGATSIELKGINSGTCGANVLSAAQIAVKSGMSLTLHGYLPADIQDQLLEMLVPTGVFLRECRTDAIMVVHAHTGSDRPAGELIKSTARAFAQLVKNIQQHDLPIKPALEINRWHGVDTPGTTYDGLLETARTAAPLDVKFCWDMGHTCSSCLKKKLPVKPPSEFAAKVIHTHVHDLAPDGVTHWPLTGFNSHIVSCISRLEAAGYTGIYNLELYPERWTAQQNVRKEILTSIRRLAGIRRRIIGG